MDRTDESLRDFGWNIQKLIEKKDLTRQESYDMFRQVLENQQPDLQQGAFLAALSAKPETPQEIAGAWEAITELDTNRVADDFGPVLVENSGTGMDRIKTFNVSSAGAVVAAAGGAVMARHGARALTSACGTVDVLEAVGVDVECGVDVVAHSIRETGLGLFNGMSPLVHPQALGRILSQIRFGSTLNMAASLASPCRPTHALRGVHAPEAVEKMAEVMKEIGYQRAMVVHGFNHDGDLGMDELSVLGESLVLEFQGQGAEEYRLAPEDLGLERARLEDIAALGDVALEAVRLVRVLAGRGHEACRDFTCLNAGAVLYVTGLVSTIKAGVKRSRELIENGDAFRKLARWAAVQADAAGVGIGCFRRVCAQAGLEGQAETAI